MNTASSKLNTATKVCSISDIAYCTIIQPSNSMILAAQTAFESDINKSNEQAIFCSDIKINVMQVGYASQERGILVL